MEKGELSRRNEQTSAGADRQTKRWMAGRKIVEERNRKS